MPGSRNYRQKNGLSSKEKKKKRNDKEGKGYIHEFYSSS